MRTNVASSHTPAHSTDPAARVTACGSVLKQLARAVAAARDSLPMRRLTTVHPCFVNGVRTLVHKRGLECAQPDAFRQLAVYARSNGFKLLEDRRKCELTCRDERRRIAPMLMFAAGLFGNVALAEDGSLHEQGTAVMPTIEIIGSRAAADRRAYTNIGGKRFVSSPHGEVEQILMLATEVRAHGERHRVRTRGLNLPSEYTSGFIDRYDYTVPGSCGGQSFSFYEGEGFAALGYHTGDGKVILDVLAGGGPFAAPRLWGAYDQVLNSNIRMDLMFGNGLEDGMGVLMASYKIGLMPVMRTSSKNYYGELYARAVALAATYENPDLPQVRQAGTGAPAAVGDAG